MEQFYDMNGILIQEGDVLFDFEHRTSRHVTTSENPEDSTLGFYIDSEFYPLSHIDLTNFTIMPKASTTVGPFDKQVMDACIQCAQSNMTIGVGGPFGAAVVKDKQIISIASNRVLADKDPTAHAEMVAIRRACKQLGTHDLSGCELYATGYPCPMCLSAIMWANIRVIYVAGEPEDAKAIGFRDDFMYGFISDRNEGVEDPSVLTIIHDKDSRDKVITYLYNQYDEQNRQIY